MFKPVKTNYKQIVTDWYRNSRCRNIIKQVFPTLTAKLWDTLEPAHAVKGFSHSGLFPFNNKKVVPKIRKEGHVPAEHVYPRGDIRNVLIDKLADAVKPQETFEVQNVLRRKGKRVQQDWGECLTYDEGCERIRVHEEEMAAKRAKKGAGRGRGRGGGGGTPPPQEASGS